MGVAVMHFENHANIKLKLSNLSALCFLLMSMLLMINCGSGGSSSSGSNTNADFSMVRHFPLASGWETDQWTLFVDESEYQVNGVATKALVDTGNASVSFWTNDKNGLRLHAVWNPEDGWLAYSQPLQFADAFCKIGDKKETVCTMADELAEKQVVFTAELIAVEDVATATQRYTNCLKFRLQTYPLGGSAADFGYETLWLAKDVGFAKAQSDENSYLNIFAQNGETRQLLSYYITPSDLSVEEAAVREAYMKWIGFWNAQNISALSDMTHEGYYETCKDKAAVIDYWVDFFSDKEDYSMLMSIEDVIFDGDDAYALREYLETYLDSTNGKPTRRWGRSTVRLRRDQGEWKIYGDQLHVYPSFVSVYPRVTPSNTTFATPVEITDCATNEWADSPDQIASLTMSGPAESGIVDFQLTWDPIPSWRGFWNEFDLLTAQNGFYTFQVEDLNGNYLLFTDYLSTSTPLDIPELVSPGEGAIGVQTEVNFAWEPVNGANGYKLEVYEVDETSGLSNSVISSDTDQTTYNAALAPGKNYDWRVRARYFDPNDGDEYDSESRSAFRRFSTLGE